MTDEKAKTPPKTATTDDDGGERPFTVEELRERSRGLFDVSPLTIDGAFADTSKVNWTAADAKKRIDGFLGRKEEVAETEQTA